MKRAIRPKLFALLLLVVPAALTAQDVQWSDPGATTCALWTSQRTANSASGLESWLIGYESGWFWGHYRSDLLKESSPDALNAAVDADCKMTPKESVAQAAKKLTDTLTHHITPKHDTESFRSTHP